jgi:hypothetical protein
MSPKDNNKQVSAAVRILHQKRDASARATHLMVKNDSLITYEKAFGNQAAVKKFFIATFLERKKMSTKTITKRIALVAASALALGGFSVISASQANAAPQIVAAASGMYDTTNFYQVVGGQATIEIGFDTNVVATVSSTGVGTIVSATPKAGAGLGFETLTSVTSTGFQHNVAGSGYGAQMLDTVTVVLSSAVVGAQVITVTPLGVSGVPGTPVTKTITWTASGTLSASSWKTYLIDTDTALSAGSSIADSTVPLSKTRGTAGSPATVAVIAAQLLDGNGNSVTGATVSVTLSGPGLIGAVADNDAKSYSAPSPAQRVASVTTEAGGWVVVHLSGDGTSGVATVTLTSGTVATSRSVTFTGTAASYTLTALTGTYGVGAYGSDDSLTASGIKVVALDSASGAARTGNFWATSSDKTVATVSSAAHDLSATSNGRSAGTGYIAVTGVKAGKSTITIRNTDPAGTTAPTVTQTIEVEVTSGTADAVTMALDKATYSPGEPGVLSVTLTNAAGRPVADGTYTIFAAATPLAVNLFMQSNSTGANGAFASGVSVTTVGGVAAFDIYAPSVSGTLSFSGTTLSSSTVSSALTQNARGKVLAATAEVSGGAADANAALALDAANAATDAANNAYDEAQNATQAASDALAAVTALAKQVKTLIASVKKLTAAVAKLR